MNACVVGLWLAMVLLAVAGALAGMRDAQVLVWLLAGLKGLVLTERFMELHRAPWRWRLLLSMWLLACIGGILWLGA